MHLERALVTSIGGEPLPATGVAEVLSRQDRSSTAQCSEEAVSCGRRAGNEPGRPVCGQHERSAGRAHRTVGELGGPETGWGQGGIKLEQAGEALRNGRVMVGCVALCQARGQDAQQVIGAESGARLEEQPGSSKLLTSCKSSR